MNPMNTAPKDKVILLDVGYPCLFCGHWNDYDKKWVYAELNANMVDGVYNDTYFENEYEKEPRGWLPMPEIED